MFFTQILFDASGSIVGKGTTDYPTADAAEQAFHTAVASAISKDDIHKIIAIVFDADGVIKHRRAWERAI